MKGTHQATCSGCGKKKGSHDRNAGWFELKERGDLVNAHVFCPPCSGLLLVGLDERMGKGGNPNLRAVLAGDIHRIRRVLEMATSTQALQWEHHALIKWLADLVGRKPGDTIERLTVTEAMEFLE